MSYHTRLIDLIVEIAVENPTVALEKIVNTFLSDPATPNTYPINNADNNVRLKRINSLLGPFEKINSWLWYNEKTTLEKLVNDANKQRIADFQYLEANPARYELYNSLITTFKMPVRNAIELTKKLTSAEIKAAKKITTAQMDTLIEVLKKLMFNAIPADCNTYAAAISEMNTLEDAMEEVARIIRGEPAELYAFNAIQTSHNDGKLRHASMYDHVAKIRDSGLTELHLAFISSLTSDALQFEYDDHVFYRRQATQFLNGRPKPTHYLETSEIYPYIDVKSQLQKTLDRAMKKLVAAGYQCLEVEPMLNRLANNYSPLPPYDKVNSIEEFVKVKMAEISDTQELSSRGERRLLSISDSQTNSAAPRYSSPFNSAIQVFRSAVNYLNSAEIHNILVSGALSYMASQSLESIANSAFGFFAPQAGGTSNLLDGPAYNNSSLSFR
jgi:hypothetical protein